MAKNITTFSLLITVALLVVGSSNAQLSPGFYSSTCPNLLTIVRAAVNSAVNSDLGMGASLLRLLFSDCFVNGCDASVLLDDTADFTGEKTAASNANSLRGFDMIDTIKGRVEQACPGTVSCADILAVAGRDGVVALGGPSWQVALGRRDSTTASLTNANNQIPAPSLNLTALITSFNEKGFDARDLVALSGGHTIGQARCTTFRNRIYNETNIEPVFAKTVQMKCPQTGGDNNPSPLDITSQNVFNNGYFTNLVSLRGLLHSDQQLLFNTASTDAMVRAYAMNSNMFFSDFASAMVKMSNLSPLTGANGEIRVNCRRVN